MSDSWLEPREDFNSETDVPPREVIQKVAGRLLGSMIKGSMKIRQADPFLRSLAHAEDQTKASYNAETN